MLLFLSQRFRIGMKLLTNLNKGICPALQNNREIILVTYISWQQMRSMTNTQMVELVSRLRNAKRLVRSETLKSFYNFYSVGNKQRLLIQDQLMKQDKQRQVPAQRRARRLPTFVMDYDQIIIPGHIYQSWLQDSSNIVSRRGRKRKVCSCPP